MSRRSLPTRRLPHHPDLDQLKRQAKELLDAFLADDPDAVSEVTAHYHDADRATFALHDAQLVLAVDRCSRGRTDELLAEQVDLRRVVAVGRVAERTLGAPAVRHPSHGGARAFQAGLVELLDRDELASRPA